MADRPLVLHLNGVPGVGKSTLARRWVAEHPGTLLLDVDVLRTWVGGWREDFFATGGLVRPLALAMITTWAGEGHSLVLPQLITRPEELARFEAAAVAGGARFAQVVLGAEPDDAERRFAGRVLDSPHLEAVHRLVEDAGPGHLAAYASQLATLAVQSGAVVVSTRSGEQEAAYAAVLAAVDG